MKTTLAEERPFQILLADCHPVFRFGLRTLLSARWQICGEAAEGRDAVEKCRRLKPGLVILDISLPGLNGLDAARQMLRENPQQKILIATAVESEEIVRECLEAGIRGWVLKSDGCEDLLLAVEAMQAGKAIFTARISELIMEGYKRHQLKPAPAVRELTLREREIVQLVCEGSGSKDIAVLLGLSLATVETHRSNILRKLGLHSIAELVLYAVRNEIVHVQLQPRRSSPPPAAAVPAIQLIGSYATSEPLRLKAES